MNNKNPSVLKLSNGEDIICRIIDSSKEKLKIEDPLLMDIQQRTDREGKIKETLGLVRWLKPFTEEEEYFIEKNSIVITVPASIGLIKYYEHILKSYKTTSILKSTQFTEEIEDDLDQLSDEEILDLLNDVKERTIH